MNLLHPLSYFDPQDHTELSVATTYDSLLNIAFRILGRMPAQVCMVCGPITTGGVSRERNIERFNRAIDTLAMCGENVFTQMPFEGPMQCIREGKDPYHGGAELLNSFYLPIFRSGKVVRLCFLPDWQTSNGATWEHERAGELSIERKIFRDDFESITPDINKFFVRTKV
jgi:hypothetical protein